MRFKKEGKWTFGYRKGKRSGEEQFSAGNNVPLIITLGREPTAEETKTWESTGELTIDDESYGRLK